MSYRLSDTCGRGRGEVTHLNLAIEVHLGHNSATVTDRACGYCYDNYKHTVTLTGHNDLESKFMGGALGNVVG
jgi:hypothetical protein